MEKVIRYKEGQLVTVMTMSRTPMTVEKVHNEDSSDVTLWTYTVVYENSDGKRTI